MGNKIDISNSTSTKKAIKVENLVFRYGNNLILNDISFSIEEGKITTIMGANGCGKSTLFSLMTKNLTPKSGTIRLRGVDIKNIRLQELATKISIVHQNNTSMDDITVEKLVSYGRTPYMKMLGSYSAQDKKLINHALKVTNLTEYRHREISKLSGGQRQRVWIAMALAQNTKILFLDEPTTHLDIRYQLEILQLVKELNEKFNITIIMVLHDINQAITYSDYIIGLQGGKIIAQGHPNEAITESVIKKMYGIELKILTVEERKIVLTV